VLEAHGWGSLGEELNLLSKRGEWDEMGRRIDDDVLHAFAIVAPPDQIADQLLGRFGDVFTRCGFYSPTRRRKASGSRSCARCRPAEGRVGGLAKSQFGGRAGRALVRRVGGLVSEQHGG